MLKFHYGKKLNLFILIFAMVLITMGCNSSSNEKDNFERDKKLPTERISIEELNLIKSLSLEDIEEYIIENVNITLKKFEELTLEKIDLSEDKLLLKKDSYEKVFGNVSAEIYLNLKAGLEESKKQEISNSFSKDLLEILSKGKMELVKLKSIDIIYITDSPSDNINSRTNYVEINNQIKSLVFEQKEDLNILDKNIYEIFKLNLTLLDTDSEYEVIRLGLEGDILKIETNIYYFNGEEYESNLQKINDKTINTTLEDENILKILQSNHVNNIQFIYNGKWYKDGNSLVYKYELSY